ncbi:MAG: hypothetical protein FWC16_05860 [Defluviitaleaceae bacterium]|nr:hypothetical protein [Defluviitaleaceae bacterium]MCL2274433.1 hypothetical protein [Defluviitaleaceae bacterium]
MRKFQRSQIIDLLHTLREAQAAGQYAACQDGALSLCDFIDQLAGEGTATVALLEAYCELIFKAHNGEIGRKPLDKKLSEIEKLVSTELAPTRIEIAFISYKAAMSDSLETIYLAAKDDPNCDAYWIPVPYYEKNPDGSLGKMHYEGAAYYKPHFQCIDWQAYDIEARRPDIIYTFNPYDDSNRVTAIHPNFYIQRLKNCTDMLVYVPYFVMDDNATLTEAMDGLWVNFGVLYADRVIVQSQSLKETVIKFLKEGEIKNNAVGSFGDLDKKLLPLGSPKFDNKTNTPDNRHTLPPEWTSIIAGRKVILYNTSFNNIDEENKCITKLRDVLAYFKARTDVALWWRPHPLSTTAIQSMRPELLPQYEQIVTTYRQEGWGIYDNTPELQRAVDMTDGYYGDGGSLVGLCQQMGKLVMKTNLVEINKRRIPNIRFYVTDAHIWVKSGFYNTIYKIDKDLQYIISSQNMTLHENEAKAIFSANFVESNDCLYFAPTTSEIIIYNMITHTVNKITYKQKTVSMREEEIPFLFLVKYEKYIFYIPASYPAIMRLNTETHEISFFTDWLPAITKHTNMDDKFYFGTPLVIGEVCWMACWHANMLLSFNMETCKSQEYVVGNDENRYKDLCYDGAFFWLSPRTSKAPILKWHPQKGECAVYSIHNDEIAIDKPFCICYYSAGNVWFLPLFASHVYKIDVKSSEMTIVDELEPDCQDVEHEIKPHKFSHLSIHDNTIYATKNRKAATLFVSFNCNTLVRKCYNWQDLPIAPSQIIALNGIYQEGACTIDEFLQFVGDVIKERDDNKNQSKAIGLCIHDEIKHNI